MIMILLLFFIIRDDHDPDPSIIIVWWAPDTSHSMWACIEEIIPTNFRLGWKYPSVTAILQH